MVTPLEVLFAGSLAIVSVAWFAWMIAVSVPRDMRMMPRVGSRFTRWHWNDERQLAKLRHPSARADVYECWDPRCDCHMGKSLPYDWEMDSDLTSDRPVHYYS